MIKAVTTFEIEPENQDRFEELAMLLVRYSETDNGCEYYSCNRCVDCDDIYCFIEFWTDMESFLSSMEHDYFTTLFPQLVELSVEEPTIEVYEDLRIPKTRVMVQ